MILIRFTLTALRDWLRTMVDERRTQQAPADYIMYRAIAREMRDPNDAETRPLGVDEWLAAQSGTAREVQP